MAVATYPIMNPLAADAAGSRAKMGPRLARDDGRPVETRIHRSRKSGPERVALDRARIRGPGRSGTCRAGDLGDQPGGPTNDLRNHGRRPGRETRVDDPPMAERSPTASPPRAAAAPAAPTRRPHGDRSISPSAKTVTLRCSWRAWVRLPEDDAVDARQLGLVRVDHADRSLERRSELALERDQLRQGRDVQPRSSIGRRACRRRRHRTRRRG